MSQSIEFLLPRFAAVVVDGVEQHADLVTFRVRAKAGAATCSGCGRRSTRVHARYRRVLDDVPLCGRHVRISVLVRRFKCVNAHCPQATFSEQVAGLTTPFARRTPPLTGRLTDIALALAGRPGARLASRLAMPCCRDVLIRLIRAQPLPDAGRIEVLGVDDFAIRRRHTYNTVLLDMDSHRPVDVLPGREAGTLAAWLRRHPEIEIICRDRAGAYAEGACIGAPQAFQIADRFHLWKNLCEAAEKTLAAYHGCQCRAAARATAPETNPDVPTFGSAGVPTRTYALAERTRARFDAVHACLGRGLSRNATARELNLDIQTVRRFANATHVEQLLGKVEHRPTALDPYVDLVNQRWNEGITNARAIFAEAATLGFTGTERTVQRYLNPLRPGGNGRHRGQGSPAPTTPAVHKPRHVTRALLTHPDHLTARDALILATVTARCQHLQALHGHIRTFAALMSERRGHELPTWLQDVDSDDLPTLHSFANGIRHDLSAVINGLVSQYNSGAVEGNVTRIKRLKRNGYGRANFDLLKAQILLAP